MKRTLAVVVLALSATLVRADSNLLLNASFEDAGSEDLQAQYWEQANPDLHGGIGGTASREHWRARTGTHVGAIRGTWAGGSSGMWWQERRAEPGATYTFSGWFWADATWDRQVDQGIRIEFYRETADRPEMIAHESKPFAGIVESWVEKRVTATAPTDADWVRVVVWAMDFAEDGALQFDDLLLTERSGKPPAPGK